MSHQWIGSDVSKNTLEVYNSATQKNQEYVNDPTGFTELTESLKEVANPAIICEATGGYELEMVLTLQNQGYRISVVNPRPVRDLAKALNKLAKTDKIDAQIIATYGETAEPEATVLASETEQEMKAWLQRRQQLKEMIIAEKNRRHQATRRTKDTINEHWSFDKMNFYTTYSACLESLGTVDSVFFEIVKTPVTNVIATRANPSHHKGFIHL